MTTAPPSKKPRPGDLLTIVQVGELIGVTENSIRGYWANAKRRRAAGTPLKNDMPEPDDVYGRSPVWKRSTILRWDGKREFAHRRRQVAAERAERETTSA